jgi:hypothetical protein
MTTQADRDQLIRELLAKQADIQATLSSLGIAPTPKEDRSKPALDGGPRSDAHRYLKTTIFPLISVFRPDADGNMVPVKIRKEQFDPTTMKMANEEEQPKRQRRTVEKKDIIDVTDLTREELLVLPVSQLRAQPEVKHIDGELPDKKVDLVDEIMAVREAAAS